MTTSLNPNFDLPDSTPSSDHVDVMAQTVVPNLYRPNDLRVLDPNAETQYEDCAVRVVDIDENLRVIAIAPHGITPENAKGIFVFESGYMMPPTSPFGDQFMKPVTTRLKETDSIGIFWAPYGRGTETPMNKIGRMSAKKVQVHSADQVRQILEKFDSQHDKKIWLSGHSKGGQSKSNIFGNPDQFGFGEHDFHGLYAICPVPLPNSQAMLRNKTAWTSLIPGGSLPIISSMITGRGVQFDEQKGNKFFVGDDQLLGIEEVLNRLFPDSARYFTDSLTIGSSMSPSRPTHDYPLASMHAYGDRIVNQHCANIYRKAMHQVPDSRKPRKSYAAGIKGDHMSPFYMNLRKYGETESPAEVARLHYWLLSNVMDLK